jgi:hypothetical protein
MPFDRWRAESANAGVVVDLSTIPARHRRMTRPRRAAPPEIVVDL